MKDPTRLSECAAGSELLLVRSLQGDGPSADERARMALALGIGASTAIGATTGLAGAAAAATTAGASAGAKGATLLGGLATAKALVAVVAVGGLLASVAVARVVHPPDTQSEVAIAAPRMSLRAPYPAREGERAATRPAPQAAVSPTAEAPRGTPEDVAPHVAEMAPRVEGPSSRPAVIADVVEARALKPPAEAAKATPATASAVQVRVEPPSVLSLRDETLVLDAAQRALNAGRVAEASALLDRHDHAFPNAVLDLEASVLRLELLVAQGRTSEARAGANAFLAVHPGVPQARRVQTLLSRSGAAEPNP